MTTSERNVVLHVDDVSKNFGGLQALSDIDLEVEEGQTHAIIGPNGAGKSTLLNVIIGRLAPTSGAVVFNGQVLTGRKPYQINQLGVARVFQTPEIFPDLTVLQNVMVPAFAKRDGAFRVNLLSNVEGEALLRDEAEAIIEDVGLSDRRHSHAGALSRGDKRRMELAMCLIQHPRLLLLDEPTAGMGHEDIARIAELIKRVAANRTVLMVEHNLSVVADLSDTITVLTRGRVLAEGDYQTVSNNTEVREAYMGVGHA